MVALLIDKIVLHGLTVNSGRLKNQAGACEKSLLGKSIG
jgi:hypothetical protein